MDLKQAEGPDRKRLNDADFTYSFCLNQIELMRRRLFLILLEEICLTFHNKDQRAECRGRSEDGDSSSLWMDRSLTEGFAPEL